MIDFLRFNIVKKMLLGFLPVSILIILVAVFALVNLNSLSRINNNIIRVYLPLMETLDKIYDGVLAQELYGRRYVLLKSKDTLDLFMERSKEVEGLIKQIEKFEVEDDVPIARLGPLHEEYNKLFLERFKKRYSAGGRRLDDEIKKKQEELSELVEQMSLKVRQHRNARTLKIGETLESAFRLISALCILGILFSIGAASMITRNISESIAKLKLATLQIAEGKFENVTPVKSNDELGELSVAFTEMARRLKRLEEMYLDASPLTRLPGGVAIENMLKKRLDARSPLAFCLADMNNFKSFNDQYGYARGNDVLQATAKVIESATDKYGNSEDFVGHIGGDDFVILTTPQKYEMICKDIVDTFDKMILGYYDPEDRMRGSIIAKNRQGQDMSFPIMTISIAVVTNSNRQLKNHIEVGEIAAELKAYAKSLPGSNYIVDRRRDPA